MLTHIDDNPIFAMILLDMEDLGEKSNPWRVAPGHCVTIQFPNGDTYHLKLLREGDRPVPDNDVISAASPLGRMIVGRAIGESVTYQVAGRTLCVKILSINE